MTTRASSVTVDTPRREGLFPEAAVLAPPLLAWFAQARRPLPWREGYDPYAVWMSEIMLQQTQVEAVLPYYRRWMARFPSVHAVAAAPQAEVLKHWEGLGYYSRARNLHRAAQAVVSEHGGRVPDTAAALRALPGIGRYTAGAIASIAYNRREPLVDGNVARVLSRVFALSDPPRSPTGQRALWAIAEAALPADRPREFNEALMELGALVCRPRSPTCLLCPVRDLCRAHAQGNLEAYPVATPRKERPVRRGVMLLVQAGGALLVRQRPAEGLWGGLWEFPWIERKPQESAASALKRLLAELGLPARTQAKPVGAVSHGLTHFQLELECLGVTLPRRGTKQKSGAQWESRAGLDSLALSRLNHKALALLDAP